MQCHVVKNTLLQTAFSAIIPTLGYNVPWKNAINQAFLQIKKLL